MTKKIIDLLGFWGCIANILEWFLSTINVSWKVTQIQLVLIKDKANLFQSYDIGTELFPSYGKLGTYLHHWINL